MHLGDLLAVADPAIGIVRRADWRCCQHRIPWRSIRKQVSSERGHGEYHEAIALMRETVLGIHPWALVFLDRLADLGRQGGLRTTLGPTWAEVTQLLDALVLLGVLAGMRP